MLNTLFEFLIDRAWGTWTENVIQVQSQSGVFQAGVCSVRSWVLPPWQSKTRSFDFNLEKEEMSGWATKRKTSTKCTVKVAREYKKLSWTALYNYIFLILEVNLTQSRWERVRSSGILLHNDTKKLQLKMYAKVVFSSLSFENGRWPIAIDININSHHLKQHVGTEKLCGSWKSLHIFSLVNSNSREKRLWTEKVSAKNARWHPILTWDF